LVEFERSEPQALRRAVEVAAEAVRPWATQVDTALSATAAERLWSLRHAASPILARLPEERRSLQVIEDACLPPQRMGDYIRSVRRIAAAHSLPVVVFGHAGDGHVHVNLLPDVTRPGWEDAVQALLEEVTESVLRLNGTLSGEHGDGRLRAGLLRRAYGEDIVGLFARIKRAFDPLGIMNPGVILPDGAAPISRLKVGHEAAAIPSDIASELRRIEREGGYAKWRMELV
jgi:FAD/FMN-containing dehydrogenase